MTLFRGRQEAGAALASRLLEFAGGTAVVLGLPRGGMVTAAEVAKRLSLPLDVIVVRKLGVPWQPEVAMGAIAEGGLRVLDERLVGQLGIRATQIAEVERRERNTLDARVRQLSAHRPEHALTGRVAIIVDDGIATGATAAVACQAARARGASAVIVAAPVAARDTLAELRGADRVVAVDAPARFVAVGNYYADFREVEDGEVVRLLDEAAARVGAGLRTSAVDSRRPR